MQLRRAFQCASLWLFTACANFGGQSGDDGDVHGEGGGRPTGEPKPPYPDRDDCLDERELDSTSPSALGKTPGELIAELGALRVPLHWVAYDSPNFDVAYAPGPSQTILELSLSARTDPDDLAPDEATVEFVRPTDRSLTPDCGVAHVRIPVWVHLTSDDDALAEKVPGTLTSYGNSVAKLSAEIPYEGLRGTFGYTNVEPANSTEVWSPQHFTLQADLWPGGSAGMIYPEFGLSSSEGGEPSVETQPPPNTPADSVTNITPPTIPTVWTAIAVWPRLEQCTNGVARASTDAVVGVSPQVVLEAMSLRSTYDLRVADNQTALTSTKFRSSLTYTALPELVCVLVDHARQVLTFSVPTRLRGVSEGSAVAELDAQFEMSATAQTDSTKLTSVHFLRTLHETAYPTTRAALSEATGLPLATLDEQYSQFWWTWYGHITFETSSSVRQDGHFLVSSPSAIESMLIAEQVAQGGPSFGVSYEPDAVVLPGDVVFHARIIE